jgi:diadenosine tetraphosphate (Ap4A) HIT family hydrolase
VPHVHFHFIPKPNEKEGLIIGWPAGTPEKDELKAYAEALKEKLAKL